jgi:predicted nucleic acid-binding Zn ribbon protein
MAIHKAESIGTLLAEYFRGTEAETTLLERKIPALWGKVLGQVVSQFTGDMEVKNGVLYVHIHSAALRQQLFEQRHTIVKKLNEACNAKVLTDIRLLG